MKSLPLILIFILQIVNSKDDKVEKQVHNEFIGSPKRPTDIVVGLYCEACKAMVDYAVKELRGSRRETDIFDVLDGMCKHENYPGRLYASPFIGDTCDEIMAGWDEKFELALQRREVPDDVSKEDPSVVREKLCGQNSYTKSCHGMTEEE